MVFEDNTRISVEILEDATLPPDAPGRQVTRFTYVDAAGRKHVRTLGEAMPEEMGRKAKALIIQSKKK